MGSTLTSGKCLRASPKIADKRGFKNLNYELYKTDMTLSRNQWNHVHCENDPKMLDFWFANNLGTELLFPLISVVVSFTIASGNIMDALKCCPEMTFVVRKII